MGVNRNRSVLLRMLRIRIHEACVEMLRRKRRERGSGNGLEGKIYLKPHHNSFVNLLSNTSKHTRMSEMKSHEAGNVLEPAGKTVT